MIAFRPLLLLLIPTLALIRDPRPALGAEAVRIGFEDLSKRVLEHNQHVEAGQSLLSAAEASRGHLARSYLPRVTATGGYEAFRHGALGRMAQPYGELSATVSLFRGGRDMLEERARSGRVELAGAEAQQILLEELTKARKEFWSLVYQREVVAYLKDAVAQNERNLASARKRYRAGIGTETDRSEFEISGVQLAQDLARLELSIARSQRNLGALIGLPTETLIETESAIDHEHSDEIFSARLDTASHREVRAVAASHDLSLLRAASAGRWWTPSLDLYGSLAQHTSRERESLVPSARREAVMGARLVLPIFDGLEGLAEARSAAKQAHAYEVRAAQTSRELLARFESSRQELKLAHDLVHGAERNVEQARQYLAATLSEYARGLKNSPDVLGASQRYVDSRRRLADLRRDYQLARADLLAMLGR